MFTVEEHLDDLTRHIGLVRDATVLLGTRLINNGQTEFGRLLIARGHIHDASKFHGVEWAYLHVGPDVSVDMLVMAIKQHVSTNSHHPEYYSGIENMPPLDVAEMVCDCYARSQEKGTDIRKWFNEQAVEKYSINKRGKQWKLIQSYLDLLIINTFK